MSRFTKSCIFIMRNQKDYIKQKAALEREGWERFSEAVDKYLRMYDEMTEADEAAKLSEEQLSKLLQQIKHLNDLIPMQLPSGQGANRRFGAYYTKLKYYPEWDKPWRVGPDADVVVQFDDGGHRFVFWRGTNYIPHWVTDNGIWYNNEFTETWPTRGCSEPMSDKQCRYSNVRIIENHPGRVVVHWRYAVTHFVMWTIRLPGRTARQDGVTGRTNTIIYIPTQSVSEKSYFIPRELLILRHTTGRPT